jgi:ketosteroid isomerase-like protein
MNDIDEGRAATERLAEKRASATPEANVELARRCFDAYTRRDIEALRAFNDPDVEVDWSASRGVEAGVYRGIDAALRFYQGYFDAFEEIVFEPDRSIDAGPSVVIPNVARSRGREGIEVVARSALVMTFRDHRVTRICLYQETQQALEAVGLAG